MHKCRSMLSYSVPFAFLCLLSKIAKCTVQAVDHFEDDGKFELGASPWGKALEMRSWQACCWKGVSHSPLSWSFSRAVASCQIAVLEFR